MKELQIVCDALSGLTQAIEKGENTSVFGLSFGEKALFLCSQKRQVVYVTPNVLNAIKLGEEMQCFSKVTKYMLGTNSDYFSLSASSFDGKKEVIDSLFNLSKKHVDCLIISPQILMQKFCKKSDFKKSILSLKVGQKVSIKTLVEHLLNFGYKRVDTVGFRGEFSIKGDVLHIFDFLHDEPNPVRAFSSNPRNFGICFTNSPYHDSPLENHGNSGLHGMALHSHFDCESSRLAYHASRDWFTGQLRTLQPGRCCTYAPARRTSTPIRRPIRGTGRHIYSHVQRGAQIALIGQ